MIFRARRSPGYDPPQRDTPSDGHCPRCGTPVGRYDNTDKTMCFEELLQWNEEREHYGR